MLGKILVNSNSEFNNIEKCGVFCSLKKQLQKYERVLKNYFLNILI
jgi:hypothetical protein